MAPDLPNRPSANPRLHPDSSRRDLQSPRRPAKKPLEAATVWPWSALVRGRPAFLHDLPNNATPPTSAPLPPRIVQPKASGNCRADKALLREARPLGQAFPFPTAPSTHWPKFESFRFFPPPSPSESSS